MKTLWAYLRRLVAAPVFADEDMTHAAGLLNAMLWILMAVLSVYDMLVLIL